MTEGEWLAWEAELGSLDKVVIPRWLYPAAFGTVVRTDVHHFSDASKLAMVSAVISEPSTVMERSMYAF